MNLRSGFRLGSWTVYPLEGRLTCDGEERHVQPKSMDVLLALAEADGALVERDQLLLTAWDGRAQTDEPLTRCIGELRRAFGDSRAEPEIILTVPKRGYRLLPAVIPLEPDPSDEDDGTHLAAKDASSLASWRKVGVAASLLIIAAAVEVTIERFLDSRIDGDAGPMQQAKVIAERSIAVMPFVDMSPGGDQEYFSDGISEELLNVLTKRTDLRVISRSSAFSFKGRNVDVPTIAGQLRVTYILEGSVRTSGEDVRITAQLIDSRSDGHIWSQTYERKFEDIFAIQDEIAANVVEQLQTELLGDEAKYDVTNPEAYALILQARFEGRRFSPEALERSVELYQQALQIDPESAAAWAELSRAYRRLASQGLRPYDEAYRLAREAVERALYFDPRNVAANRGMAFIARNYDRDLPAAAQYFTLALEYSPSDVETILGAASLAQSLGRVDQAVSIVERAVSLDPISPIANVTLGLYYQQAGRIDEAIGAFRIAQTLSPDYIGLHHVVSLALLQQGELEAALAENAQEMDEGYRLISDAMIYYGLGDTAAANAALDELIEKYEQDSAYNIAYVFAYRNEADLAFEWLDRAVGYNDTGLSEIVVEPLFDNVRSDPRWLAFLERIGKSPGQLVAIDFDLSGLAPAGGEQ